MIALANIEREQRVEQADTRTAETGNGKQTGRQTDRQSKGRHDRQNKGGKGKEGRAGRQIDKQAE